MKLDLNAANREKIPVKDIERTLSSFPDISVKFDGFMDYNLAELKLTGDVGYYTISADLKFDYNNTPNISAPSNYTPVKDIINEITLLSPQTTSIRSQNCLSNTNCSNKTSEYDFIEDVQIYDF